MRRTRFHPLIALFCALFLLGAQQAAFAHMIGHIGGGHLTAAVAQPGDEGHGEALNLSHVCTTCVGLSALDAAPPPALPALAFCGDAPAAFAFPAVLVAAARPFFSLARAPPAFL